MSSYKATSVLCPANTSSRPAQTKMTLVAFALLIILNCINSSATLSTSDSSAKPDSNLSVKSGESTAATATENTEHFDKLSQVVKRAVPQQYNFGLGKRSFFRDGAQSYYKVNDLLLDWQNLKDFLTKNGDTYAYGNDKRSKPQRFSFGLGKRSEEVVAGDAADTAVDIDPLAEEGDDLPEKRKADRYSFGLGKRFSLFGKSQYARNLEEFKRRYNFGLGK